MEDKWGKCLDLNVIIPKEIFSTIKLRNWFVPPVCVYTTVLPYYARFCLSSPSTHWSTMPPKKNANSNATASSDRFILAWTTVLLDIFIKLLKEQHDLGKGWIQDSSQKLG